MQDGFIKSRLASTDIGANRIAAFTSNRNEVKLATASTQPLAGIVDSMGGKSGGLADVQMTQIADVVAGGTLAPGDPLTTDGTGAAVKATKPGSGVTTYCVGFAQEPAVSGDLVPAQIAPFVLMG